MSEIFNTFGDTAIGGVFKLARSKNIHRAIKEAKGQFIILWNTGNHSQSILVDQCPVILESQHILFCTYMQDVSQILLGENLVVLSFNRSFYCIHTHDEEVSCNGLLFFGSDSSPVIALDRDEQERLSTLIAVLQDEFETKDQNQEEMLRILLKRFIIRCTRLARRQLSKTMLSEPDLDIVRQYNVLVEEHFRVYKQVSDYAELMHRSPKTINNVFAMYSDKTPLQVIHDRLILEAKRLLIYTDKPSKEIALELGLPDPSQFSRFFRKYTLDTPTVFRSKYRSGRLG